MSFLRGLSREQIKSRDRTLQSLDKGTDDNAALRTVYRKLSGSFAQLEVFEKNMARASTLAYCLCHVTIAGAARATHEAGLLLRSKNAATRNFLVHRGQICLAHGSDEASYSQKSGHKLYTAWFLPQDVSREVLLYNSVLLQHYCQLKKKQCPTDRYR